MPSIDDVTGAYCRRKVSGRRFVATDDAGRLVPPDCWAGADFSGANLFRADLFRAGLSGADLGGWERGPDGYARRRGGER